MYWLYLNAYWQIKAMPNVSLLDFTCSFEQLVWARNTMPYVHARHKSINFLGYPSATFLSASVLGNPLYKRVKKVYSVGNFIWFQGVNFSGMLEMSAVWLHAVSYLLPRGRSHAQTRRLLGITRAACNPPSATVIQLPSFILPWFEMKRPSCQWLFEVSFLYLLFFPPVLVFPMRALMIILKRKMLFPKASLCIAVTFCGYSADWKWHPKLPWPGWGHYECRHHLGACLRSKI